ncbi:hypothetical protein VKT23_010428 [Stygiomarasmius scandens]|uniref:SH3 domain-containing protein n=1 Tax=Marasmiellus scandens TaxID=2682957 RepID=A0ABR1JBM2_9AGAR
MEFDTGDNSTFPGVEDLPSNEYIVIREFISSLPDELAVKGGEIVLVTRTSEDGWSLVRNKRGGTGMVPFECLIPKVHPSSPSTQRTPESEQDASARVLADNSSPSLIIWPENVSLSNESLLVEPLPPFPRFSVDIFSICLPSFENELPTTHGLDKSDNVPEKEPPFEPDKSTPSSTINVLSDSRKFTIPVDERGGKSEHLLCEEPGRETIYGKYAENQESITTPDKIVEPAFVPEPLLNSPHPSPSKGTDDYPSSYIVNGDSDNRESTAKEHPNTISGIIHNNISGDLHTSTINDSSTTTNSHNVHIHITTNSHNTNSTQSHYFDHKCSNRYRTNDHNRKRRWTITELIYVPIPASCTNFLPLAYSVIPWDSAQRSVYWAWDAQWLQSWCMPVLQWTQIPYPSGVW